MCRRRPCWPTPADAARLIDAGLAGRLMVDWWFDTGQDRTVWLLSPAIQGREARPAPAIPSGVCTFLDERGLCGLHERGLKPTEGQLSMCAGRTPEGLHERIGRTWDTPEGAALVKGWRATHERVEPVVAPRRRRRAAKPKR
jgi:hypothetical protein